MDVQDAAHLGDPLRHADQAIVVAGHHLAQAAGNHEPVAVVHHPQPHIAAVQRQAQLHVVGPGVAEGVPQARLRHPEEGQGHPVGEQAVIGL